MEALQIINKRLQAIFSSLQSCACTDKYRKAIHDIFWDSSNKRMVATNGRVILWHGLSEKEIELIGIPEDKDARYSFDSKSGLLLEAENEEQYPEYWRVNPIDEALPHEKSIEGIAGKDKYKPYSLCSMVSAYTGMAFDAEYFDCIRKLVCEYSSFTLRYSDKGTVPVRLSVESQDCVILLMPLVK